MDHKKTMAGLFVGLAACNCFALVMNLNVAHHLNSDCSAYTVRTGTEVFQSSADADFMGLRNFVAVHSVPRWVNPLWRIPMVAITDAAGQQTFVQGDTVPNWKDDQYNTVRSNVTLAMVKKLEAADVSSMKFPIEFKWTQIEGADVQRVLKVHYALAPAFFLLAVFTMSLSFKGYVFLQAYIMWGGFAFIWYATCIDTTAQALAHPPTGAEIAAIPADQIGSVLKPCDTGPHAPGEMETMFFFLAIQIVITVAIIPVGRRIAKSVNAANGTVDAWDPCPNC